MDLHHLQELFALLFTELLSFASAWNINEQVKTLFGVCLALDVREWNKITEVAHLVV
jgi:hypothetical protein